MPLTFYDNSSYTVRRYVGGLIIMQRQARPGRRKLEISLQEEPEVVRQIDAICQTEGLSRSSVIRKLLRLGLARYGKRENIIDALEKASA